MNPGDPYHPKFSERVPVIRKLCDIKCIVVDEEAVAGPIVGPLVAPHPQ